MADNTEPTVSQFNSAESAVLDVLSTSYPSLLTKSGAVVRELVVRPLAYLYAWLYEAVSTLIRTSSASYLSTSQLTENPVADAVASNYFVTRRQGTSAKGAITAILKTLPMEFRAGTSFNVDGALVKTVKRVVVSGGSYISTESTEYVPAVRYKEDSTWLAMIPVEAASPGKLEISPGASVTMNAIPSSIERLELTTPITGGSDVETDAELMERARSSTAAGGVGSYYGLRRLLDRCPVPVLGLSVVAGESSEMWRARYNTLNMNPGGFVDCYVKTQNQPSVATLADPVTVSGEAVFRDTIHAGLYGVRSVTDGGSALPSTGYSLSFTSSDDTVTDAGARLGTAQELRISAQGVSDPSGLSAEVMYMPGISAVQNFLDSDENKFIGLDIMVKAAVPVVLSVACVADAGGALDDDSLAALRQAMSDRVNAYPVGARICNFSDMAAAAEAAVPGVRLRLPCTIGATTVNRDGSVAAYQSNTGTLDMGCEEYNTGWDSSVYFFSLAPDAVRIEII